MSPIGSDSNTWTSPRSLPVANMLVPGLTFDVPRRASMTNRNCPTLWLNT